MKVRFLSSLSLISIMFGLLFGIPVQVEASSNAGLSTSNDLVGFLGLGESWVDGIDQAYLVARGIDGEPIGCDTPGTPVLISPTDASTIADDPPTFNWELATASYEYQLQVDNNPDFLSTEIDTIVPAPPYTPGAPLGDGLHHWRVRGHNTGGECNEWGEWSAVWTFTIDTSTVVADFSGTPTSGIDTDPVEVIFTDLSSGDYDTCSWDFGDGGTSPDCSPAPYIYVTSGVYTVTLTASGAGGSDTEIKPDYITVHEHVTADFSASPTHLVEDNTVTITNTTTGDYDTCSWDFGDGGTSSLCAPGTYIYNTPGVYTVSLTASGNGGSDTETKTDHITVYDKVVADFIADTTELIGSGDVTFTDQSTGDYDTCSWDFGDGDTSSVCDPALQTYTSPGAYTVSLTASGNGGSDTETKTNYINVYTEVVAEFLASDTTVIEGDGVTFTNLSTGDYDTCSWNFGDGGTSTVCDISASPHTYTNFGVYTVSLTASGNGGSDTETKVDHITVYDKVVADFIADTTELIGSGDVTFTDQSTGDYDTCSWDFGDGDTSSVCDPALQTYTSPGAYTVSLTASGNGGSDTETKTNYINVYTEVVAEFLASDTTVIEGDGVTFTNLSTGDYDTCSWNFGDGGTSTVCDISASPHTYTNFGVYTVSLTASGNGGSDTETKVDHITVSEGVVPNFSATPTELIDSGVVTFTNESTGDFDTCSWDFGDGDTSSDCDPLPQTYASPGAYTVSLTVSGTGGEGTETKTDYIKVYVDVRAEFSGTPTVLVETLPVTFTNESTGDFVTCSWDFGDSGASSDCDPAPHIYDTHGSYTVTLTVSGNGGEDTETKPNYITVTETIHAEFFAIPTELVAGGVVTFTNELIGDYDTCSWDFGDGGTSSLCSSDPITYTYNITGTYTVTLTVSGLGGEDTETKPDYITVYDPVHAQFSADKTSGPAPLQVSFTNESTGDYDTCSWIFGDGGTSSDCSPAPYTYDINGIYTVILVVSGNGGQDTETKVDYIVVGEYKIYTPLIFNDDGL